MNYSVRSIDAFSELTLKSDHSGGAEHVANVVAEFETITPNLRVWVLMEIMGTQTRVAVGADQLRVVWSKERALRVGSSMELGVVTIVNSCKVLRRHWHLVRELEPA